MKTKHLSKLYNFNSQCNDQKQTRPYNDGRRFLSLTRSRLEHFRYSRCVDETSDNEASDEAINRNSFSVFAPSPIAILFSTTYRGIKSLFRISVQCALGCAYLAFPR